MFTNHNYWQIKSLVTCQPSFSELNLCSSQHSTKTETLLLNNLLSDHSGITLQLKNISLIAYSKHKHAFVSTTDFKASKVECFEILYSLLSLIINYFGREREMNPQFTSKD